MCGRFVAPVNRRIRIPTIIIARPLHAKNIITVIVKKYEKEIYKSQQKVVIVKMD